MPQLNAYPKILLKFNYVLAWVISFLFLVYLRFLKYQELPARKNKLYRYKVQTSIYNKLVSPSSISECSAFPGLQIRIPN